MLTLNTILEEMKEVPVNRLEELYQFVHSLTPKPEKREALRKKILSYGGIFGDLGSKEYKGFVNHTKKIRTGLFDRTINL